MYGKKGSKIVCSRYYCLLEIEDDKKIGKLQFKKSFSVILSILGNFQDLKKLLRQKKSIYLMRKIYFWQSQVFLGSFQNEKKRLFWMIKVKFILYKELVL